MYASSDKGRDQPIYDQSERSTGQKEKDQKYEYRDTRQSEEFTLTNYQQNYDSGKRLQNSVSDVKYGKPQYESSSRDDRNKGFTLKSYEQKSDSGGNCQMGGYSRTYFRRKFDGSNDESGEVADGPRHHEWCVGKHDVQTGSTRRTGSAMATTLAGKLSERMYDNRSKGFTATSYQQTYDELEDARQNRQRIGGSCKCFICFSHK